MATKPTTPSARQAGKTVDEYIAGLPPGQQEIVSSLRALVREVAPEAVESIKWAQPVFEHGGPMVWMKAHKNHVNIGFWRGADLLDPSGILEGEGDRMRHVKIGSLEQIPRDALLALIRQAMALNAEKGDPTRKKQA